MRIICDCIERLKRKEIPYNYAQKVAAVSQEKRNAEPVAFGPIRLAPEIRGHLNLRENLGITSWHVTHS